MKNPLLAIAALTSGILARDIPSNVKSFASRIKNGQCTGGKVLKSGFYDKSPAFTYCRDSETGVIYLHGKGSLLANMDVDCDGKQKPSGDGRCGSSTDTQSETAFKDTVQEYSKIAGKYVSDLNANFIPYVVFGNYGSESGYTVFHPTDYGVKPLSVMAVVCGDQLIYGVWGDENGDDGPPLVGEASISLATACFGKSINGNKGHEQADVLYIAFPGSVSDTVHKHADWAAQSYVDFEASVEKTGDALIQKLK